MENISIVGLDLAKSVFQVHSTDDQGRPVLKKKLKRSQVLDFFDSLPPCLVGMEACGGSHHWAREIRAIGHQVRLIPPAYVKPFVKRNKTDAADAAAICEAMRSADMRFVSVKSIDEQAYAVALKAEKLLVRQRTQIANAIRGHMHEFGVIARLGHAGLADLLAVLRDNEDQRIPPAARQTLLVLADQYEALSKTVKAQQDQIREAVQADKDMRRLTSIPGVGVRTAAAVKALAPDMSAFASGRDLAAWVGLTPLMHSSGGKDRIGHITKMGNNDLRTLLVLGAAALLRHVQAGAIKSPWLEGLLKRRPFKVAAVALASKNARIIWAMMTKGTEYRKPVPAQP